MKKKSRMKKWLVRFRKPDKDTLLEMGKDIRTLALTVIGATLIGVVIDPKVMPIPFQLTLIFGVVLWVYGIILTRIANMIKTKKHT